MNTERCLGTAKIMAFHYTSEPTSLAHTSDINLLTIVEDVFNINGIANVARLKLFVRNTELFEVTLYNTTLLVLDDQTLLLEEAKLWFVESSRLLFAEAEYECGIAISLIGLFVDNDISTGFNYCNWNLMTLASSKIAVIPTFLPIRPSIGTSFCPFGFYYLLT